MTQGAGLAAILARLGISSSASSNGPVRIKVWADGISAYHHRLHERPALVSMLSDLQPHDLVLAATCDRVARGLPDLRAFLAAVSARDCSFAVAAVGSATSAAAPLMLVAAGGAPAGLLAVAGEEVTAACGTVQQAAEALCGPTWEHSAYHGFIKMQQGLMQQTLAACRSGVQPHPTAAAGVYACAARLCDGLLQHECNGDAASSPGNAAALLPLVYAWGRTSNSCHRHRHVEDQSCPRQLEFITTGLLGG